MQYINYIYIYIFSIVLFSSCQSSKYYLKGHSDFLKKRVKVYDEHLLVKNTIINHKAKSKTNDMVLCADSVLIPTQSYQLDSDLSSKLSYELSGMLRQRPNRKILFGRPFLFIYNLTDTIRIKYKYNSKYRWERKEGEWIQGGISPDTLNKRSLNPKKYRPRKFRKFLMKRIGEPPVIADTTLAALSARSMQNHLIQKGFLEARVGYKMIYKKHKASVEYYYNTGAPLLIDTVIYNSEDKEIYEILSDIKSEAELKKGQTMDKSAFLREKTRLTSKIRNSGYYNFNWNYITFTADTINASKIPPKKIKTLFGKDIISNKMGEQGEQRVQIFINVISPSDTIQNHTSYTVKNVYIVLDEPKVEIHKTRRKYLMDTSHVVLRPPRKDSEIDHMYKVNMTEFDTLVRLEIMSSANRNIVKEFASSGTNAIFLINGAKYPYWVSLDRLKRNINNLEKASLEYSDSNKIEIVFSKKGNESFTKSSIKKTVVFKNLIDSNSYKMSFRPYRRRFVRKSFRNKYDFDSEDIPIHIILRKPAISSEIDPIKKANEEKKIRKKNYIISDKIISQMVSLNSGEKYNYDSGKETINRISDLEIFRFPRVEYVPSKTGLKDELDAYVFMQKARDNLIGGEADLNSTTNNSNLGLSLNFNYKNRNVFKGAEVFLFNVEGGLNFDWRNFGTGNVDGIVSWIELLDISSSLNLFFPKIIGFRNWSLSVEKPKSRVAISYRYLQQSTDFRVSSFDAIFGYEWLLKGGRHKFAWNPFMLNFTLRPVLELSFDLSLKESNFALWASLNEQYFLPGTNFTYIFTPLSRGKHSLQVRTFAETTGNTALLLDLLVPSDIEIFGTVYSQYLKGDLDIRYTYNINKKHSIASRFMLGAAMPLGESLRVPYSRQFFLGGPSSMRGWNMRELGPGRLRSDPNAQFQLGDIRLEMNAEYRFMFNSWIGGALFSDIGNIWYAKKSGNANTTFPYANLETGVFNSDFLNELAINIGTGLRFDLSFFVLRFDFAFPVRDPSGFTRKDDNGFIYYTDDKGFPIYWKFDWRRTNFLLAVGYPF